MSLIHLPNPKKMPDKVTQKKLKRNTVIFLRKDYSQEALLQIIESLVEEKLLRKSDLLIWSSVMINIVQQKAMTLNGKQGVSIDIYRVIDSLKGSDNPDFKKHRVFNYDRNSKKNKLEKYLQIGLLKSLSDAEAGYEINYPTKANSLDISKKRSSTYLKKHQEDWQLISTEAIEKMGTIQVISNYIGRCVRLTDKIKADVIKANFIVKSKSSDEQDGVLMIEATSLKNSSIVIADDLLLVDYVYSMINEKLEERENTSAPIENKFTFDLASVARDFGWNDSGNGRSIIYTKILRISSTEYAISSCKNASWLMSRLGFLNENGEVFTKARLRWFRIAGEQTDDVNGQNDGSSRYVTISLPDFIIANLNDKNKKKTFATLPMFKRDKIMLQGKSAGVLWTLNNYLMTMLAVPGYMHGPVSLDKFLTRWQPYLEEVDLLKSAKQVYLKAITNKNSLLYVTDLHTTKRCKVKLIQAYSLVGSFLVKTKNITPFHKQIGALKYDITAIRLNTAEISMCRKRIETLKKSPLFVTDDLFKKKLSVILSNGGKHAVDKRLISI